MNRPQHFIAIKDSRIRHQTEQEAHKNSLVKLVRYSQIWTSRLNNSFNKSFNLVVRVSVFCLNSNIDIQRHFFVYENGSMHAAKTADKESSTKCELWEKAILRKPFKDQSKKHFQFFFMMFFSLLQVTQVIN